MGRRTFLDILQDNSNIDVDREYQRLKFLFYKNEYNFRNTLYSYINKYFMSFRFRKGAISLDDFEQANRISFKNCDSINGDLNSMLIFCEYVYCFCSQISYSPYISSLDQRNLMEQRKNVIFQIDNFIESIGYTKLTESGVTIFVPKEPAAVEVSECMADEDAAYKVLCYNHYSLQGDLEGKRQILEKLAHKLEPSENELQQINPALKKHLFGAFNNLNIRHNNIEATDGDFNKNFAQLQDSEKEELYDSIYKDCLIAFLELENSSVRQKVKQIIAKK